MGRLISDKFAAWQEECEQRFQQLKANEEELNRIFIDIYGLPSRVAAARDVKFGNGIEVPENTVE